MLETISTATLDGVTGGADPSVLSQLSPALAEAQKQAQPWIAEVQKQAKPWIDALAPVLASSRGVIMNFVPSSLLQSTKK